MKDKIQRWWRYTWIRNAYRDCIQGIKNLWRWFPTIWQDRNWDHTFIYSILAKKLEFQAEYIKRYGVHNDALRDAEKMLTVVRLIERQQQDFYHYEYHDFYESEWKTMPNETEVGVVYCMDTEIVTEHLDAYFAKYPRQYKRVISGEVCRLNAFKDTPELKDKLTIALEIALENNARSRKLLFKIIEENIERWWD